MNIARGTKVRATWAGEAEGFYVRRLQDGAHELSSGPQDRGSIYVPAEADFFVLLHDEPGVKSIVVDCDDDYWVRVDAEAVVGWRCAQIDDVYSSWADLNEEYGPLKIVVNL